MKAFEKQHDQRCQSICFGNVECEVDCHDAHAEGWRAALEWVDRKAAELNSSAKGLDVCTLYNAINKELEEK